MSRIIAAAIAATLTVVATPVSAELLPTKGYVASIDEASLLTNFAKAAIMLESCNIPEKDVPGFPEVRSYMNNHRSGAGGASYGNPAMGDPFMALMAATAKEKARSPEGRASCEQGRADLTRISTALIPALMEFRRRHIAAGHAKADDPAYADVGPQVAAEKEAKMLAAISAKEGQRRLEEFQNSPEQVEKRNAENLVRLRDAIGSLPILGFGTARVILPLFDDEATQKAEEELVAEREMDSICDAVVAVGAPAAKGLVVDDLLPYIAGKKKPSIKGLKKSVISNVGEAASVAAAGKSSDRCK
mgnify:CR=1 FL=1